MSEPKQEKPKHTRRSRKSLVGQISDVLFKITRLTDKAFENESVKPAVLNALMAQLDTLRWLQERADKEITPSPAKVEDVSTQPQTKPDPLDSVVEGMLRRHASPPVVKLETPRPIPAPQPVPTIEKDPDLLI